MKVTLGEYLGSIRTDRKLTLRAVEEATNKEVSNAYLSQIENGKIQYPVKNFRFNQSIIQLLAPGNVDLIGKSERVGNSEGQGGNAALLPALKVKEFHFSSQSEAV